MLKVGLACSTAPNVHGWVALIFARKKSRAARRNGRSRAPGRFPIHGRSTDKWHAIPYKRPRDGDAPHLPSVTNYPTSLYPPSRRVTINVLFARVRSPQEKEREGEERKNREITARGENKHEKKLLNYLELSEAWYYIVKIILLYKISDSYKNSYNTSPRDVLRMSLEELCYV